MWNWKVLRSVLKKGVPLEGKCHIHIEYMVFLCVFFVTVSTVYLIFSGSLNHNERNAGKYCSMLLFSHLQTMLAKMWRPWVWKLLLIWERFKMFWPFQSDRFIITHPAVSKKIKKSYFDRVKHKLNTRPGIIVIYWQLTSICSWNLSLHSYALPREPLFSHSDYTKHIIRPDKLL